MYAHREEMIEHERAKGAVTRLAEGSIAWGIPTVVLGEFLRVVTHRRIFDPPSSLEVATTFLERILESPSVRVLAPGRSFWRLFVDAARRGRAAGDLVLDAQIAAVCLEHGAKTVLTNDADFHRFPGVTVRELG